MISVVYSTRKKNASAYYEFDTKALNDIEIIEYINNNEFSLAEIYNKGLQEASNDIILFAHDDIFLEKGYDQKILESFHKNSEYGILGVAGSTLLDKDGIWWKHKNLLAGSVYHKQGKKKYLSSYSKTFENEILEVAVIDGVFIAVNRKKIKSNFDESIGGFHFYDIAFCVKNALANVKIGIISDLSILHKSIGELSRDWHINKETFLRYYGESLPLQKASLILDEEIQEENKDKQFISVVIPTKNNFDLLKKCIISFYEPKLKYSNFEIIVADTGSDDETIQKTEKLISDYENIRLVKYDYYNFAKINNDVVKNHISEKTELLLFCNDDIIILNDAIRKMVNTYNENKETVGTIGARLLYYDGRVQHGGIILLNKQGTNEFGLSHEGMGSFYGADIKEKSVFGNTGAFLMVSLKNFKSTGFFNEKYDTCLEDVQLNLDLLKKGKINIYNGEAVCLHKEGSLRKQDQEYQEKIKIDFKKLTPEITSNIKLLKKNKLIVRYG